MTGPKRKSFLSDPSGIQQGEGWMSVQSLPTDDKGQATLIERVYVGVPNAMRVSAAPVRKRKKSPWEPTDRERAILSLPSGLKAMEAYCRALDQKRIPFPEGWQKNGRPRTHLEAWNWTESLERREQLQNLLKCERSNVWGRIKRSR